MKGHQPEGPGKMGSDNQMSEEIKKISVSMVEVTG